MDDGDFYFMGPEPLSQHDIDVLTPAGMDYPLQYGLDGHFDHQTLPSSNPSASTEKQETPGSDATESISGPYDRPVAETIDLTQVSIQNGDYKSKDRDESASYDENRLLSQIREIFPKISHTHVTGLLQESVAYFNSEGEAALKEIVVKKILEKSSYPKQQRRNTKATEAGSVQDDTRWERVQHRDPAYIATATEVLARKFPFVPMPYILLSMQRGGSLFSVYVELSSFERSTTTRDRPYTRLVNGRKVDDRSNDLLTGFPTRYMRIDDLSEELQAAENRSNRDAAVHNEDAYRKREEEENAEKHNEEEHARAGRLVECQCCYLDVPLNRAVHCEAITFHFFCFSCIRKNAETQVGLMKYQLQCIDTSGCQAGFARNTLKNVLGPSLMKKLDSLQQQDEVERAGLEGLESCPFCEFKAVCPPVEDDREFRCQNPACEEVSCRLCKANSHVPQTCAEAAKERGIPERHLVEEAMSEALIRKFPRCKVSIVKVDGCNKMVCSKCHCMMCYVCRRDITREGTSHWGPEPGSCPGLYRDSMTDEQAVNQAEKRTIDQLITDNPNLTREELLVHRHTQTNVVPPLPRHGLHRIVPYEPLQADDLGYFQFRPYNQTLMSPGNPAIVHQRPFPYSQLGPRIPYPGHLVQGRPEVSEDHNFSLARRQLANAAPILESPGPGFRHPSVNQEAVSNHDPLFDWPRYPGPRSFIEPVPHPDPARRIIQGQSPIAKRRRTIDLNLSLARRQLANAASILESAGPGFKDPSVNQGAVSNHDPLFDLSPFPDPRPSIERRPNPNSAREIIRGQSSIAKRGGTIDLT